MTFFNLKFKIAYGELGFASVQHLKFEQSDKPKRSADLIGTSDIIFDQVLNILQVILFFIENFIAINV